MTLQQLINNITAILQSRTLPRFVPQTPMYLKGDTKNVVNKVELENDIPIVEVQCGNSISHAPLIDAPQVAYEIHTVKEIHDQLLLETQAAQKLVDFIEDVYQVGFNAGAGTNKLINLNTIREQRLEEILKTYTGFSEIPTLEK